MTAGGASVLERNVAAVQRRQPGFAPPPGQRVQFVDGVWRLREDGQNGIALHSRDPQREADRLAQQLLAQASGDVIVVVGFGLGFLADALERRGWTGRLLAIEPLPDAVTPMLQRRDWHSWVEGDRLRLLVGPEYAGAADCWSWFGDGTAAPPVVVHPVLERVRAA